MCGFVVVLACTHFADAQSRHKLRRVMRLPSQVPRLRLVAQRHVRTKLVSCTKVKANNNKNIRLLCCAVVFVLCVSSHRACRISGTQRHEGSKATGESITDLLQTPSYSTHAKKMSVAPLEYDDGVLVPECITRENTLNDESQQGDKRGKKKTGYS